MVQAEVMAGRVPIGAPCICHRNARIEPWLEAGARKTRVAPGEVPLAQALVVFRSSKTPPVVQHKDQKAPNGDFDLTRLHHLQQVKSILVKSPKGSTRPALT